MDAYRTVFFVTKGDIMGLKVPSVNQLITLAVAMLVLSFVMKFLPENIRALFRI